MGADMSVSLDYVKFSVPLFMGGGQFRGFDLANQASDRTIVARIELADHAPGWLVVFFKNGQEAYVHGSQVICATSAPSKEPAKIQVPAVKKSGK
jgi:hypothetical protein